MRVLSMILLLASLTCLVGCSESSQSYLRAGYDFYGIDQVAIVDVVGVVQSEGIKKQIENAFTAQLLQKGYAPVVKEYVRRRLAQNNFVGDDMSPEVFAIEAGRVLEVPAVMVITVPNFGVQMSITGKLLSVKDGSVLWIGQASKEREQGGGWKSWFGKEDMEYEYNPDFDSYMYDQPYDQSYNNYSSQNDPYAYLSDAQSGGYNAGEMYSGLNPQEERQVYDLVACVCESLPERPIGPVPQSYAPQQAYTQNDYMPEAQPQMQPQPQPQPQPQQYTNAPETLYQYEPPQQQQQPVQPKPVKPKKKFSWRDILD